MTLAIISGNFSKVAGFVTAQLVGAILVWIHFLPHWAHTSDPGLKPACFSTGPAIRRGQRIAHAILPIPDKGGSDWGYALTPVIGGALAGLFVKMAGI